MSPWGDAPVDSWGEPANSWEIAPGRPDYGARPNPWVNFRGTSGGVPAGGINVNSRGPYGAPAMEMSRDMLRWQDEMARGEDVSDRNLDSMDAWRRSSNERNAWSDNLTQQIAMAAPQGMMQFDPSTWRATNPGMFSVFGSGGGGFVDPEAFVAAQNRLYDARMGSMRHEYEGKIAGTMDDLANRGIGGGLLGGRQVQMQNDAYQRDIANLGAEIQSNQQRAWLDAELGAQQAATSRFGAAMNANQAWALANLDRYGQNEDFFRRLALGTQEHTFNRDIAGYQNQLDMARDAEAARLGREASRSSNPLGPLVDIASIGLGFAAL